MREKMKLTFLGTGTSTGVPSPRCRCRVCSSTDPRDKRLRCSALLNVAGKNLLIDCGPDFRQQILGVGSPDLRALLVTHHHYDHVGGIDDLRPYCSPDGFDIYCNSDVDKVLRRVVPYSYAEDHYPGAPVFHNHVVKPSKPFMIDDIEVLPLPVNHYLLDILAFRIGNLAYVTDAKHIPDETIKAIKGVDTLVINALREKSHISHLNLREALDVIDNVKPRMAYLIHESHDFGLYSEVAGTLPPNVAIACDGMTIDIP